MKKSTTILCIPTYNESQNIKIIYEQIIGLKLDLDILFIDDNSPDGTGAIIDSFITQNPHVHALHRPCKSGIGSAHKAAIDWAYTNGYETCITMDCDFSHSPKYIQAFCDNAKNAPVVVGSRYMEPNCLDGWNIIRKILTHSGHILTRFILGMPYDATGAFRLYSLSQIDATLFSKIRSNGYSFFYESLYIIYKNKIPVCEIPIHLPPRTYGHSKMQVKDMVHSLSFLGSLCLRSLFHKKSLLVKP